jgi:prepilin-type N-terminal cleavage/methylation domain-containing protein
MPENHNQSGMTLVEILVAMVMMGILTTGIYNLFRVHNLMAAKQEETTHMQQELLSVMVQISEDLRMCGYSTGSGANVGFNATATDSTSVYCTKQQTGPFGNTNTEIGYIFDTAENKIEFFLNSNATWITAANNIADLNFTYRNIDGDILNATTDANAIRYVDITATAQATDARSGLNIKDRTMNTRVYCRNMGI